MQAKYIFVVKIQSHLQFYLPVTFIYSQCHDYISDISISLYPVMNQRALNGGIDHVTLRNFLPRLPVKTQMFQLLSILSPDFNCKISM